jgi:hypothetical protein
MKHPIPMNCGDEVDALGKGKKFHKFRAGMRALVKRSYWKRARKKLEAEVRNEVVSWNIEPMATKDTE